MNKQSDSKILLDVHSAVSELRTDMKWIKEGIVRAQLKADDAHKLASKIQNEYNSMKSKAIGFGFGAGAGGGGALYTILKMVFG